MKFAILNQVNVDAFDLLKPTVVNCGSALSIAVYVQRPADGFTITGCKVRVTNADGTPLTIDATLVGSDYVATFPASHFERYGRIENGVAISVLGADENGVERVWIERMGSLYIRPTDAQSEAGDPGLEAKYLFVDATVEDGVATLQPFANNQLDLATWECKIGWEPGDGLKSAQYTNGAWTVTVVYYGITVDIPATDVDQAGASASRLSFTYDGGDYIATRLPQTFAVAIGASSVDGAMRDLWFVVTSAANAPTVTWPASCSPANDDADNLVAEANATTVFLISEYEPGGKFLVARQVVEAAA